MSRLTELRIEGMITSLRHVTPERWRTETSMRLHSRDVNMKSVDKAFDEWHSNSTYETSHDLFFELHWYLVRNGGNWNSIARNVASNGLMKNVYDALRDQIETLTGRSALPGRTVADLPTAHTRLGVLYLFAHTNVEVQDVAVNLEGMMKIAGGAAHGGAGLVLTAGQAAGAYVQGRRTADVPARLQKFPDDVGINTVVANAPSLPSGREIGDFARWLKEKLHSLAEWIAGKLRGNVPGILALANKIIEAAVKYVASAAIPVIGQVLDIKNAIVGIVQTVQRQIAISAADVDLRAGHPAILARSIESAIKKATAEGLWNQLKTIGVAGATLAAAPIGTLAKVTLAAIEFLIKGTLRYVEVEKMQEQLRLAKLAYDECAVPDLNNPNPRSAGGYRVRPRERSLVTDNVQFTGFYQKMCDASPCVPILTLNSSVCGSLMDMIKLFERDGTMISQETFDEAAGHFGRLKTFGSKYLRTSGFRFTSTDEQVRGLLGHAINHDAPASVVTGGSVAAALLGWRM